jgi:SAM-dependent methyltransferase
LIPAQPTEAVARYYAGKLAEHGTTPAGVDWNSAGSQELRFAQLMRTAEGDDRFSLNDYGCGYGALLDHLDRNAAHADVDYRGYDAAPEMVAAARERFGDRDVRFTADPAELEAADYTVASGIFNVRLDTGDEAWLDHVLRTLDEMRELSRKGFAFNALTRYSDADRMRDDLYYADPGGILDHCIRRYSRRVAILHDYELYEFTTLVRLTEAREDRG